MTEDGFLATTTDRQQYDRDHALDSRFSASVNFLGGIPAHRPDLGACWQWLKPRGKGYGYLNTYGSSVCAHRFSYERHCGPIPAGLHIDHLCRNRACVNPAHLEPVTIRENLLRGHGTQAFINSSKTHCIRGHEFTLENTGMDGGSRTCRVCDKEKKRRQRLKKRAHAV